MAGKRKWRGKNGKQKISKSLVALAICFSMALLPIMQAVSSQTMTQEDQLKAFLPQINALNAKIEQNLTTYVQSLTTNTVFTTTPAMDGSTPASQNATYFSAQIGATEFNTSTGVTLGSIFGHIWAANGTVLYNYEAWIDPATMQIVSIMVYPFSSNAAITAADGPSLSAFSVYTIGSPNTRAQTIVVPQAASVQTSVFQQVNSAPNGDTWGGYEVPSSGSYPMNYATCESTIVQVNTGNYGLTNNMGVSAWCGFSNLPGGNPILYQGGWEVSGSDPWPYTNEVWSYHAFVEVFNTYFKNDTGPMFGNVNVNVGDTINADMYYQLNGQNTCTVESFDGTTGVVYTAGCYAVNSTFSEVPYWAQFIVEDPSYGPQGGPYTPDRLAGWSGALSVAQCYAEWSTNLYNLGHYLLGSYLTYTMCPWEAGTVDAITNYTSSSDAVTSYYMTSS